MPATLEGRTILVTRPRAEAATLVESLRARGARVIVAPAIRLVPAPAKAIDAALDGLVTGAFAWVLVTSRAGAEALLTRLEAGGRSPRDVQALVGAVGEGTASALREGGLRPSLVPTSFTTDALGRAMPSGSGTVLLARADIAPEGFERVLRRKGWRSSDRRVPTRFPGRCRWRPDALAPAPSTPSRSAIHCPGSSRRPAVSPSAMAAAGHTPKVVCIGPVTAAERDPRPQGPRDGRPAYVEGLVAAVERALRGRSRPWKDRSAVSSSGGRPRSRADRELSPPQANAPHRGAADRGPRDGLCSTPPGGAPREEGIDEPLPIASMPGHAQHPGSRFGRRRGPSPRARSWRSRGTAASRSTRTRRAR